MIGCVIVSECSLQKCEKKKEIHVENILNIIYYNSV